MSTGHSRKSSSQASSSHEPSKANTTQCRAEGPQATLNVAPTESPDLESECVEQSARIKFFRIQSDCLQIARNPRLHRLLSPSLLIRFRRPDRCVAHPNIRRLKRHAQKVPDKSFTSLQCWLVKASSRYSPALRMFGGWRTGLGLLGFAFSTGGRARASAWPSC